MECLMSVAIVPRGECVTQWVLSPQVTASRGRVTMVDALLTDKRVTARKRHVCDLCENPILPGTVHRVYSGFDDGAAFRCREHLPCTAAAQSMWDGDWWSIEEHPINETMAALSLLSEWIAPPPVRVDRAMAEFGEMRRCVVGSVEVRVRYREGRPYILYALPGWGRPTESMLDGVILNNPSRHVCAVLEFVWELIGGCDV